MKSLRNLCALVTVVLAAFALPSFAGPPSKIFGLTMSPATVSGVPPVTLTATYTNLTPNGNATVNTLILSPPTAFTANASNINSGGNVVSCPATTANGPVPPGSICVANLPSVLKAGNSFNGDTFAYQALPSSPTTTFSGGAAEQFTAQPGNALVSTAIPPPVKVSLSTTCGPANGTVTLATTPACTGTCLSGNIVTTTNGVATFLALKINTPGTYTLKATSTGFPAATSNPFTIYAGDLACGDDLDPSFVNPADIPNWQPGYAAGSRGSNNKNGPAGCIKVPYTFTNSILTPDPVTLTDNTVHLIWDTNVQRYAVFTYTVNWKARPIPASGWTDAPQPNVAWFNLDGSSTNTPGTPAFTPGLACLGTNPPTNMPAPYGSLVTDGGTSITIDTTFGGSPPTTGVATLPAAPFPAVIGTERIEVGMVSGPANATVLGNLTRGVAGTTQVTVPAFVMSTPLPIIPVGYVSPYPSLYAPGAVARMCIQENGWTAYGDGQVYDFTTFIDADDGWGGHP